MKYITLGIILSILFSCGNPNDEIIGDFEFIGECRLDSLGVKVFKEMPTDLLLIFGENGEYKSFINGKLAKDSSYNYKKGRSFIIFSETKKADLRFSGDTLFIEDINKENTEIVLLRMNPK